MRKDIKSTDGKPFSKENQPSPEAKSAGKKRAKALRELASLVLTGDALNNAKELAKALGLEVDGGDYTVENVMTMRQIQKALAKGDTRAYNACMDRLKGKPKQEIDHTSNGESIDNTIIIKEYKKGGEKEI